MIISRKNLAVLLVLAILVCTLAGCKSQPQASDLPSISDASDVVNPFQQDEVNTGAINGISHGPRNPNLDENERLMPLVFSGDDIRCEYYVNASGQAKNVGFLMFVNGIPQPYKIDETGASYEYMHIFELKEDNVETPFTFIFSPVTGKQGESLKVIVVSIYNPSFAPDMDKTTSFGGYHAILPASYSLQFETDASFDEEIASSIFGTATLSTELVTNQLLETISNNGMRDVDMDIFNSEIFNLIYFDGEMQTDNLNVPDSGTLQVKYMLCGHAGLAYETTFYLNHQPIASTEGISNYAVVEKGAISVITFDIELDKLGDFNTFYVVSVPKNSSDFPNGIFEPTKTQSILLHK